MLVLPECSRNCVIILESLGARGFFYTTSATGDFPNGVVDPMTAVPVAQTCQLHLNEK